MNKNNGIYFSIVFTILCVFGIGILKNTVLYSSKLIYAILMLLLCVWGYRLIYYRELKISKSNALWLPFLLLTMVSYLLNGDLEKFIYWFVCLTIIIVASKIELSTHFPLKIFMIFGVIAFIGVLIQMIIPNFYYSTIANKFTVYSITRYKWWASSKGYVGFATSLGQNSIIFIYAEAVAFISTAFTNKKISYIVLSILFFVGVCFAGEKSAIVFAIIIPMIVSIITEKNINKKIKRIFYICIALGIVVLLFLNNLSYFSGSPLFGGIAKAIILFQSGEDITSNRSELFPIAIKLFKTHPLVGVGVGKFSSVGNTYTDVHNMYLQILCEEGIVGFLFFIIPLMTTFVRTIRLSSYVKENRDSMIYKFALYTQIYFIFYGLIANGTIDMPSYMMYFIAIGLVTDLYGKAYSQIGYCERKE